MLKDYNELRNERDSLDGDLNRMSVTDDEDEMESMYEWALRRVVAIYEYNVERLKNKKEEL